MSYEELRTEMERSFKVSLLGITPAGPAGSPS
jgi:hypothetical protein